MHSLPQITILLASYQGAAFLPQQLDSISTQEGVDWSLIMSDDGSRDATITILDRFAADHPEGRVQRLAGPAQGATQNFLSLIRAAPDGQILALSDQDDVWLPGKLARALQRIGQDNTTPVLYCARTIICDERLENRYPSREFTRPHGFHNALVQACTAGNTIVVNPAAAAILKQAAPAAQTAQVVSHDWWAYQVISGAGGQVIWDPEPALLYRQHDDNEMGQNDSLGAAIKRVTMLMGGEYRDWLIRNIAALRGTEALLTDENRRLLDRFEQMLRQPGPQAAATLHRLGLYRQGRTGQIALYLATATGRLRIQA